jgi:hypothetical protein
LVFLMGVIYNVYPMPDVFYSRKINSNPWNSHKIHSIFFYFILGIIIRNRYEELLRKSISKKSIYCISVLIFCYTFCGIFFYAENYLILIFQKFYQLLEITRNGLVRQYLHYIMCLSLPFSFTSLCIL